MAGGFRERRCCGLNCSNSDLIDAHIIPKAFGRFIRGKGPNMSLSLEEAREAKPQLGEYDSDILCSTCDRHLGKLDEYAIDVCKDFPVKHRVMAADTFEMSDFDGDKFSKFILSVLWRASISRRPKFAQVDLGPYEDKARDVLFGARDLRDLRSFEVIVLRYKSKHLDMTGIYSLPVREPFTNFNTYGFSLGGFRVVAKLDARPLPRKFKPFVVNESNCLVGAFVEYEKTPEFHVIKKIAAKEMLRRDGVKRKL